ncbi:MAG: hypothetical protein LC659_13970, partial [Myxococcales bacterium]|nr:hypothetical protein [Myxococcales bacterium]
MFDLLFPLGFLFSALGAFGVRFAFTRDRRIKRALKNVKQTKIADAKDGKVVKLVGELVYAGHSIASPLSQRTCAYYSVVVEEYRGRGTRGRRWREIIREEKGIDFYLRDDSDMALVRISGDGHALPALVQDRRARTSPIISNDPDLERFLNERGRSVAGTFFRKNLRAYEGVLEAGERVAVGGLARW